MSNSAKKNKIILNWMPPAMIEAPSPSMSILKQYLQNNGFKVEIIYWNLKFAELQSKFLWMNQPSFLGNEKDSLMLFFNYLAINYNDNQAYNYVKAHLMALKPQYFAHQDDQFDLHMKCYANEVDLLLNSIIDKIQTSEILYYALSVNLYQWICSSIIAKKIKQKDKNSTIIIGGIGTKNAAIAYLDNFDMFDYAIWGEGEIPLFTLSSELSNSNLNETLLINTAFRKKDLIITSEKQKNEYVDLSSLSIRPDFSDYIEQKALLENLKEIKLSIPVEMSRSCHWKRCRFCYLNTGYKFRWKSVFSAIEEVRFMIKTYNPFSFNFLDNDLIGGDYERFSHLLDELIVLKEEFPDFTITLAEIITKGISSFFVKKMSLAGFVAVQIGYESPSNAILKKINKKNSFASNLLFIKFANIYKINVNGANVIMGLLEETTEDIIEAIKNLHSLRFFLKQGKFRHNMSPLGVMHASPYYKDLQKDLPNWNKNQFLNFLPKKYLKQGDINCDILEVTNRIFNPLWNDFQQIEQHYISNFYEYELLKKNENIIYRERLNGEITNEFEFDKSSLDWYVLESGNDVVTSLDNILSSLETHFETKFLNVEIFNILENLISAHLIYASSDYSEIVTIIDINSVL
jgi:radical SAM superfamily enzyme YgiQ (UPF0313 family)